MSSTKVGDSQFTLKTHSFHGITKSWEIGFILLTATTSSSSSLWLNRGRAELFREMSGNAVEKEEIGLQESDLPPGQTQTQNVLIIWLYHFSLPGKDMCKGVYIKNLSIY